ncbi:hypothetical protein HFO42_07585 [Rhizobium leguminosarum]|uniref:Caspase family p20 domain-containing protein n=1 Tax=Rhizobium leguminosarum TaxID=384 RepID=A0AAJ1A5Y2_RHILE|nr:caspase family protein [Rhizobium leguminosarum]MBY5532822.1 hypothetical protein [Rhizobium leguminosarum]MBY5594300.1 hypothetical protein [Rhizobium leguminosarum]MBY5627977.1 hypothetical protein [Rhizobium leguminosarum]
MTWFRALFSCIAAIATLLVLTVSTHAAVEKRVALVIGNSAYEGGGALVNPANDADDISIVLRSLGFEVTKAVDVTGDGFAEAVDGFSRSLNGADVALFYYSGHGIQVEGINYLLPVDFHGTNEISVKRHSIDLNDVIKQMEAAAKVNLVFLDACRNNPFAANFVTRTKSVLSRGLANQPSGANTMIVYATAPGTTASDGNGRNSPFTAAILENIETPGIEIEIMMKRVTRSVSEKTHRVQSPERLSKLSLEFYFKPADQESEPKSVSQPAADTSAIEDWRIVENTNDKVMIEAFLKKYSSDPLFTLLAKRKLATLNEIKAPEITSFAPQKESKPAIGGVSDSPPIPLNPWIEEWNGINALTDKNVFEAFKTKHAGDPEAVSRADLRLKELSQQQVASLPQEKMQSLLGETNASVDVSEVQAELKRLGCYADTVDGKWGSGSNASLASFNKYANASLDGEDLSPSLLDALKSKQGSVCPSTCESGMTLKDGDCVKIVCIGGTELRNSACVAKKVVARTNHSVEKKKSLVCDIIAAQKMCEEK